MVEEKQDIVNDNDEVIGVDTRENIWKQGRESRVRVVNLFVVDEWESVLMPVRSKTKKNWPLCYDFACGENVVSGESYEQAIVRGIKEELGLDNMSPKEIGYFTPRDGSVCFMKVYLISVNRNTFCPMMDAGEVDHFEWMTKNDVKYVLSKSTDRFKRGYKEVFEKCLINKG